MIVIFYGTSAELIKMLGIVKKTPRSEQFLICSSQHHAGLQKVHKQLGIEPDVYLSNGWKGGDVANMKQMLGMMLRAHGSFAKQFASIKRTIKAHDKERGTKSIALVHGDTLTTVIGSYMGRILGLPIGHVEAGLRSGIWNNPFPEELDRRFATKLARYHFAPNPTAIASLKKEKVKGEIINTQYNTAKDAIDMADEYTSDEFKKLKLPKKFCLALLHRTELIENKEKLEEILKTLADHASEKTPVLFTEHTTTREKIEAYGLRHYFDKPGFQILPKQPYFDYMAIIKRADYIVADGGGIQEDAFFIGVPIMIHRKTTERDEGLGLNADISRWDIKKVIAFLKNHKDKSEFSQLASKVSPSQIVVDYLAEHHFIKP